MSYSPLMASSKTKIGGSLSLRKSLTGGFTSHAKSQTSGSLSVARSLSGKSEAHTDINPVEIEIKCILIYPKPLLLWPVQNTFVMNELKFNVVKYGDLAPPNCGVV